MGGSSSLGTSGSGGSRKPRGSGGGDGRNNCPAKFKTAISSPVPGLSPGSWLEVILDHATDPPRVVFVDLTTKATVGSITGIPDLDILVRCLAAGVAYRAYIESVSGGRIDVTVIQQ